MRSRAPLPAPPLSSPPSASGTWAAARSTASASAERLVASARRGLLPRRTRRDALEPSPEALLALDRELRLAERHERRGRGEVRERQPIAGQEVAPFELTLERLGRLGEER